MTSSGAKFAFTTKALIGKQLLTTAKKTFSRRPSRDCRRLRTIGSE
jgi:hypothetical protein